MGYVEVEFPGGGDKFQHFFFPEVFNKTTHFSCRKECYEKLSHSNRLHGTTFFCRLNSFMWPLLPFSPFHVCAGGTAAVKWDLHHRTVTRCPENWDWCQPHCWGEGSYQCYTLPTWKKQLVNNNCSPKPAGKMYGMRKILNCNNCFGDSLSQHPQTHTGRGFIEQLCSAVSKPCCLWPGLMAVLWRW